MKNKLWSKEEIDILTSEYIKGYKYVMEILPNRTKNSILYKAFELKLKGGKKWGGKDKSWSEEELSLLREKYPSYGSNIPQLKKTKEAIRQKASKIKLECNFKGGCTSTGSIFKGMSGSSLPSWKGGRPLCVDCGNKVITYGRKRCRKCGNIKASVSRSGEKHFLYNKKMSLEWRNNLSKSQKKLCEKTEHKMRLIKQLLRFSLPSAPEKKFIEIINKNELEYIYTGDGKYFIDFKNPDFIHPQKKIVIEVFGRFIHDKEKAPWINIPEHRTYQGTMNFYEKRGYKCIIFWDDEIDCMSNGEIISKIREIESVSK